MSLLLKNALVLDLQSPYHNKKKNIFIKNGVIDSFGESSASREIDCSGLCVSPGFFDLNSDFSDPGHEHREDIRSGSQSASNGGFTDVHLVPCTQPVVQTKGDIEYMNARATKAVDLHASAAISEDLEGENLTEMIDLKVAGAKSFSEGDNAIWNSKLLLKSLQYAADLAVPIIQNARDRHLASGSQMHEGLASTKLGLKGEPSISEELAIQRDLTILKYAGGRLHFSRVSSAEGVNLIKKAKKEGLNVTCDVSLHHLLFNEDSIEDFDSNFKSLPPFRTERDRKALIKGIKDGVIDAICSSHRPQDQESKQLEFDLADPGAISLQTFFPALRKVAGVPLDLLVEKVTDGPRRVLGLEEVSLDKGSVAKLALLDIDKKWMYDSVSNVSKSQNSPFLGQEMTGKVRGTINRNTVTLFE